MRTIHRRAFDGATLLFLSSLACGEEPAPGVPANQDLTLSMTISADGIHAAGDAIFAAEGFQGSRLFRIGSNGSTEVVAEGLKGPIDIAVPSSGDGSIFTTSFIREGNVSRIAPDGSVSILAEVSAFPSGLVAGLEGELYVSHYGPPDPVTGFGTGDSVVRVSPSGAVSILSEGGLLEAPVGLDIGPDGTIYTANFHTGEVIAIAPDGTQSLVVDFETETVSAAIGHLAYGDGALYVTRIGQNRVERVDLSTGNRRRVEASFRQPNGVAWRGGTLWVAQTGRFRSLRRFPSP